MNLTTQLQPPPTIAAATDGTVVPPRTPVRMRELDFLRGVAILLVLGHHAIPMDGGALAPAIGAWHRFGWTGVDLFFVLSGMLVGGLLLDEVHTHGNIQLKRFYIRRAFKIWPLYYLYLTAATLAKTMSPGADVQATLNRLLPNFLHIQNYTGTPLKHTWSLAVEEHFYLVLPLCLLAIVSINAKPKIELKGLIFAVGIVALAACAFRIHTVSSTSDYIACQWMTHTRADSLALGVLLAYLLRYRAPTMRLAERSSWRWGAAALICLSTVFILDRDSLLFSAAGYFIVAIGYAIVCLLAIKHREHFSKLEDSRAAGLFKTITLIGTLSYPIYLFHFGLGQMLPKWVLSRCRGLLLPEVEWLLITLLYIVVVTAIGWVLVRITERPILMLRDRLFPSRGNVTTLTATVDR